MLRHWIDKRGNIKSSSYARHASTLSATIAQKVIWRALAFFVHKRNILSRSISIKQRVVRLITKRKLTWKVKMWTWLTLQSRRLAKNANVRISKTQSNLNNTTDVRSVTTICAERVQLWIIKSSNIPLFMQNPSFTKLQTSTLARVSTRMLAYCKKWLN